MGAVYDVLKHPDGSLKVSQSVFDDAVAWLLLQAAGAQLPPEAEMHVGAFAVRAGVLPEMTAEAMRDCVDAYFAKHPLPADVAVALTQAMRAASSDPTEIDAAVHNVLGTNAPRGVLERKSPPPPGSVAAGPLARFALPTTKAPK